MMRKTLVLFSIVMLISAVTVFACGDKTKTASVDKASTGEYACNSAEKGTVKSADGNVPATVQTAAAKTGDAACPYMKANESGTHECTAECAAMCTAAREASVKSAEATPSCCPSKATSVKSAAVKEAAVGTAAAQCTKAAETVKSASEEKKEAVDIDKTVMVDEKAKAEKL
jgi:hypothetical protein